METEITDIGKVAITPQKDYQNERTYEWLDVVTYDGAGYMCIAEDGCTGIVPTNTDCWQLLADKGHFTEEDKEEFKKAVVEESKTEINEHTDNKKTELNNYTTELEKSLENELDTYKTEKESQMDLYKATLETEMANKKDSLIEEIETAQNGFDENAEEKTNTFNSNVETKTTEFNNNYNAKTEEFNNNSTEKINAFNSNAEEKIVEYDAHAESVLTETEDLFNALNTEKASGTEIYIDDAKACRVINAEISGMYKQETTKGINLINVNEQLNNTINGITKRNNKDGSLTLTGTATAETKIQLRTGTLKEGKYTYKCFGNQTDCATNIYYVGNVTKENIRVFTVSADSTNNYVFMYVIPESTTINVTIKPMLVNGEYTADTFPDFEPYTGEIASPNPDYPQAIEQVESIKLNVFNKNLLNLGTQLNGYANENLLYFNGDATAVGFYFRTEQLPDTIYVSSKNGNRTGISYYDQIPYSKLPYSERDFSNSKDRAIKVNKNYKYIHIQFSIGITQVTEMQIEKGKTKTDYKLSQVKAINIDLKGNKLCAISDTIKDKLLIDRNGNVALQKNVSLITLKKDNIVSRTVLSNGDILYRTTRSIINSNNIFVLCNYYIEIPNISSRKNGTIYCNTSNSNSIDIIDNNASITTVDEYKTFVENKQIEVYYALATPEIIDLGQLTELPKTFEGINNIWAETNLGNTEIEIEYVQDVKKLLEKQAEQQNARLDNIEALLSTTETSALLLDNMQTDLEKEVE